MISALFGETIDIHAGGVDLQFPHHENEIAQSECAHGGKVFARYWLHNGMLNFGGAKMSKSLGNIERVHDLLQQHPPEALRLALLSAHYRQPLDWTDGLIEQSVRTLDRLYGTLSHLAEFEATATIPAAIEQALDDDLNTPQALAEISRISTEVRKTAQLLKNVNSADSIIKAIDEGTTFSTSDVQIQIKMLRFEGIPLDEAIDDSAQLAGQLKDWRQNTPAAIDLESLVRKLKGDLLGAGLALGLLQQNPQAWTKRGTSDDDNVRIQALIDERSEAKKNRDFARSDAIRDQLAAKGVLLEDTAQGVRWKRG
jgi:cysteinyl-tRNA synthetase